MLTKLIHKIVSKPQIYDLVQLFVGLNQTRKRLVTGISKLNDVSTVLDVGGGTGIKRDLFPTTCHYHCLDIDPIKLSGFKKKHPSDNVILADANFSPFSNKKGG